MEINEDNLRPGAKRFDFAERERERIVEWRHEDAPHQVQHTDRLAGAGPPDDAAASWHACREVRGPQKPRLAGQILQHLFLVPDVVARRHHVDAIAEDCIRHVAGDAETRRRVLDVGDDEIESALLDERRNRAPGNLAAGLSKDVADEQDLHQGPRRNVRLDGDRDLASPALADARQDDAQFARVQGGARPPGIDRDLTSDHARELTEGALGEVKRGMAVRAQRRAFVSADHERSVRARDADGPCRHTWDVDDDLDGCRGFDHVDRRPVFGRLVLGKRAEGLDIAPIDDDSPHDGVHSNPDAVWDEVPSVQSVRREELDR